MRTERNASAQRASGAGSEARLVVGLTVGVLLVVAGILGGGVVHLLENAHGILRAIP
ncbi:MAG: hypothetical protein ACKO2C_03820 [Actinomycetes bacterium]